MLNHKEGLDNGDPDRDTRLIVYPLQALHVPWIRCGNEVITTDLIVMIIYLFGILKDNHEVHEKQDMATGGQWPCRSMSISGRYLDMYFWDGYSSDSFNGICLMTMQI